MKFYKPGPAQIPGKRPAKVLHVSSVFLVVQPSKIIFISKKSIPRKEDRILPYIGHPILGTIVSPN